MKRSLKDIIDSSSDSDVAAALNIHKTYVQKLRAGIRPVSARVLALAMRAYGEELDVEATLREMRAKDLGAHLLKSARSEASELRALLKSAESEAEMLRAKVEEHEAGLAALTAIIKRACAEQAEEGA